MLYLGQMYNQERIHSFITHAQLSSSKQVAAALGQPLDAHMIKPKEVSSGVSADCCLFICTANA